MRVDTAMVQPAELTEAQIVADCRELVFREGDCVDYFPKQVPGY